MTTDVDEMAESSRRHTRRRPLFTAQRLDLNLHFGTLTARSCSLARQLSRFNISDKIGTVPQCPSPKSLHRNHQIRCSEISTECAFYAAHDP